MKKGILLLISLVASITLFAQEKMYIHSEGNVYGAPVSGVDSIFFSTDGNTVYFEVNDTVATFGINTIDSISFGEDSETVLISYNENSVSVVNPLAFEGVSVQVNETDVTVKSKLDDRKIDYELTGSTSDGMFKLYGDSLVSTKN